MFRQVFSQRASEEFLGFTHVTSVLTTIAIRHVSALTNALDREITVLKKEGLIKMILCVVFGCRSDRGKGIGFYRIPSVSTNKGEFEEELTTVISRGDI